MATYSFNTTGSITYFPDNISASQAVTWSITQSHPGTSYFTLETLPNQDGQYDTGSTKSTSGSFTYDSGIVNIVKDDYKMGAVVKQGGGNLYFIPAVPITGSNLRVRGVGGRLSYGTLLDRWPNAAAAYSLRLLNSYYGGPAVRVRRSIDNEETNIGFNPVELDTATLETWVTNPGTALPADYGDGAAAAYSLRYVSSTYSGPVIRVRRSSDNNEANFTPSEITDGTLEAWAGVGNNGFVTTWYDQSGNARDATQSTASNQPQIVSSGSVITKGVQPAIDFNGTSHNLTTPDYLTSSLTKLFITSVIDAVSTTGVKEIFSHYLTTGDQRSFFYAIRDSNFSINGSQDGTASNLHRYDSSGVAVNDYLLYSAVVDTTISQKVQFYKNSSSVTSTSITPTGNLNSLFNSTADVEIGNGNYSGTIQELIFYTSDQSTNRIDIESNINNYYNIFPFDAYVTTWYDQSGNGNNAVQSTAALQPQIVSSGSVITENGKAAVQFDGNDDQLTHNITGLELGNFTYIDTFSSSDISAVLHSSTTTNTKWVMISQTSTNTQLSDGFVTAYDGYYKNGSAALSIGATRTDLKNAFFDGAQNLAFYYGTTSGTVVTSMYIGRYQQSGFHFNGLVQESILYTLDQSSNRSGIETNINGFYKIY